MVHNLEAISKFQRIKITEDRIHPGEWVLYLDDLFQLSTFTEFKYHESLITMPMCAAPSIDRILICGAGDGMSLREALKFKYSIPTMVELDPGMIEIFKNPMYAKYNGNSLSDPRAQLHTDDAINFMKKSQDKYNIIVWDFPSPPDGNPKENNLFSPENVRSMLNILANGGVFATHISIPIASMIGLVRELKKHAFYCWVYEAYYDHFGSHDTFLVASQTSLGQIRNVPETCRWANRDRLRIAFSEATEINELKQEYCLQFLGLDDFEDDHA